MFDRMTMVLSSIHGTRLASSETRLGRAVRCVIPVSEKRYELVVVDHRNNGIVISKKINHRNPIVDHKNAKRNGGAASFHKVWITADSVDNSR